MTRAEGKEGIMKERNTVREREREMEGKFQGGRREEITRKGGRRREIGKEWQTSK